MNYFERLRFYDFEVHDKFQFRVEKYQFVQCKLPAYDVKSAIIQFLHMMDPPSFIYWPNCFGNIVMNGDYTHSKVKFLFRQVIEYEHVKSRGLTVEQYLKIKVWNRHEFVPLFEDKHNTNGGKFRIKKGTNGR